MPAQDAMIRIPINIFIKGLFLNGFPFFIFLHGQLSLFKKFSERLKNEGKLLGRKECLVPTRKRGNKKKDQAKRSMEKQGAANNLVLCPQNSVRPQLQTGHNVGWVEARNPTQTFLLATHR